MPTGQDDLRGRQMNKSVCCRSLYETTNAATERMMSSKTNTVTGTAVASGLRLRASDLIARWATVAACSDILARQIVGESQLRSSQRMYLDGVNGESGHP